MERNGGKWMEDKGIMIRIGGYKNQGIGLVIESILRDVGWSNIRKRAPEDAL